MIVIQKKDAKYDNLNSLKKKPKANKSEKENKKKKKNK